MFNNVNTATAANSNPQGLVNGVMWFLTLFSTGAGVDGNVKVQISNDPSPESRPDLIAAGSWIDLGVFEALKSTDTGWMEDIDTAYRWLRFVWTPAVGGSTGTLSAQLNVKGL
jgi:hypothetical protein